MTSPSKYRIGQAASLSGVNSETIRAWETRHGAVTPSRDASNLRVYSQEDIDRLRLMQTLIDRGFRISDIATWDRESLNNALGELATEPAAAPPMIEAGKQAIPLYLVNYAPAWLKDAGQKEFCIAGQASSLETINPAELDSNVTLIIEEELLSEERLVAINKALRHSKAYLTLVLYQFSPSGILQSLRERGIMTMRKTTDAGELRHALLARHYWESAGHQLAMEHLNTPVPSPRFSHAELERAQSISKKLSCECPLHVTGLIQALSAFERYSDECEAASTADAATHAMLRSATAHARHTMEMALLRLIEDEGEQATVFTTS